MLDAAIPASGAIAADALAGLRRTPKTLPPKLFYDAEGCRLFGAITRLPEYYVTRVETALLRAVAPVLAAGLPAGCALVEYGASTADKARILLPGLQPAAYVPIDVAGDALAAMPARVAGVPVFPVAADFMGSVDLPAALAGLPRVGFFPGSTIGNLDPHAAVQFLRQVARTLGQHASLILGADLRKSPDILVPAYDDAQGVTASFNRNILARLNREAGADFDVDAFAHEARWNAEEGRIEMHLVSTRAQTVRVAGETIRFSPGESVHTENSYKHTERGLAALAVQAGWRVARIWTDPSRLYALAHLTTEH